MDLRLSAAAQCDWVDRTLQTLAHNVQKTQHDLLISGSRNHLPRCGLMAAQVPRGVQWGMNVGRYPAQAVRDVFVAVAQVVVDDEIVEPLLRMGRRARSTQAAPAHEGRHSGRSRHRAGRVYEEGLVLMWGTGQAVLAAPLNAVVLGATLVGAGVGVVVGILVAAAVGVCTPRRLVAGVGPSLAILTHLTCNYELSRRAAQVHAQGQASGDPLRAEMLWPRIKAALELHDASIARLCPSGDAIGQARRFEAELVAMPKVATLTGLGPYPPGNVDRLLQARAAFDAQYDSVINEPLPPMLEEEFVIEEPRVFEFFALR